MPLTTEQIDNIESFLTEKAEEDGIGLTPETFPVLVYKYWDDIKNPNLMSRRRKRRTLRGLKRERDRQDTDRPGLDAEIASLEADIGT